MTSEPHRRAIGSLRAVALDAPDIDHLATFYEQLEHAHGENLELRRELARLGWNPKPATTK